MNSRLFHFSSAALVAVIASLAAFQWSSILDPKTAAEIVVGIGSVKAALSFFIPTPPTPPTPGA